MANQSANAGLPRNVTFVETEDVFDNETVIQPLDVDHQGYQVARLKKKVVLFRGGAKAGTDVPAFFGTMDSATTYAHGNNSTIRGYLVEKEPKLFVLSYENLIRLLEEDDRITANQRAQLNMYLQVSEDTPPYVVPTAFFLPDNMSTNTRKPLYLNRRILNLVCHLGYDGWVVYPGTLLQRNLDAAYYERTGKFRYKLNPYTAEVALCKWVTFLREVPIRLV